MARGSRAAGKEWTEDLKEGSATLALAVESTGCFESYDVGLSADSGRRVGIVGWVASFAKVGPLIREQVWGPDGPEVPSSLGAAVPVRGVGSREATGLPVQEQWPAGSRGTREAG